MRCNHSHLIILSLTAGGWPDGGLFQGDLPAPGLSHQRVCAAGTAELLQILPRSRRQQRCGPGPPGPGQAGRHGRGSHRPRYPGQRRLQVEGGLPRERGQLAPHRPTLGTDELHHLPLQGHLQYMYLRHSSHFLSSSVILGCSVFLGCSVVLGSSLSFLLCNS